MKRIAIIGGGISGLAAAYELELARRSGSDIDWHVFEASERLGGIVETTRIASDAGEYILEGGPDGWVTEKPWARELALELGLGDDLIASNDATRKTYVLRAGRLEAIPDRMRLMVPEDLSKLQGSALFTTNARAAYAEELRRAESLRLHALDQQADESVASFVARHFGEEVTTTLAAPLLAGVFGGDVHKLSVRAVMPQFVSLEREHGSLIAGLQARARRSSRATRQPIFTSLRRGMAQLTEALAGRLPAERLHLRSRAQALTRTGTWELELASGTGSSFDHLLLATPLDATRTLLSTIDPALPESLPQEASSAILVCFTWPDEAAQAFSIPPGFGFLVPPAHDTSTQLLACTFVDQKFPDRAPAGARVIRAFFGGASADALAPQTDVAVASEAVAQLQAILGPLPEPEHTVVRRWPRSLPQYEVGHLERIARLEAQLASWPGLHLLGNSYHGVGLPDLVRDARSTVRRLLQSAAV